ncbi:NAD(P)H-binding protein [Kribbella sp. NBC_01245]|uniref:NmrA family NAD(P)-binding protein n=1 Tax=Kribbella sp. NBC_01245 TaxID=2903578 RepID=UPI002E2AAF8E|nr:NAD(P)H-binding protein [Kribbella sp. NBC_01245]
MTNTTVVLGGTGKTGRRVARLLSDRGLGVKAASRSSEHRFDWYDESTWAPIFEGANLMYVAPPMDPGGAAQAEAAVKAAAASGVRHTVLLSGRGTGSPGREFDVYRAGVSLEAVLQDSGMSWSIVRPAWFMQNFSEDFLLDGVLHGELRAPAGDGAEAFIDADDIAEVIVETLLDPDNHAGTAYALSGPRTMTLAQAAAEISAASGRPVVYEHVDSEEYQAEIVEYGLDAETAKGLADLFTVVRRGLSDYVSDGVQQVLGRAPRDFSDYVRATAATGVWAS